MANIFQGLPVYFEGVDDSTPDGCTLFTTTVLDQPTTYILRNGKVIGRIEHTQDNHGYAGSALKGGSFVGSGEFGALAEKIAERSA
jgi:hypothetical protein